MIQIQGYPGYSVTECGRIWSHKTEKWLKLKQEANGYLRVDLYTDGVHNWCLVHRIVLIAFVGFCSGKPICHHLNGNRADNRIKNLCWGTASENQYAAVKHGTHAGLKRRGEKHPLSKLSDQDRQLIFSVYHDGAYTQQELADHFNVGRATIRDVICDNYWVKEK